MKIKWYGHAAFGITTGKGTRIIIDPYQSGFSGGLLSYGSITDPADIVLTTHDHGDHKYTNDIQGNFRHIGAEGRFELGDVKIRSIASFHDSARGTERGGNLIFVISADELTLVHLGDLGHTLDRDTLGNIGPADILLLPVGGLYTIDAAKATKVMHDIGPKITVPMHYRTEKCGFPISTVDEFTRGKKNVKVPGKSELEITRESLPENPEIIVLKYAL